MALDDIPVEHPASETQRKRTGQVDVAHRTVGRDSEDRGGHEAPDSGLDGERRQPVGKSRENDSERSASRGPARRDHKNKAAGGAEPSDPPQPPGAPPEIPDPDKPTPIEEPPCPIPVPPDEPPPPIVAVSRLASARSSP
jgi:hypothetical protein